MADLTSGQTSSKRKWLVFLIVLIVIAALGWWQYRRSKLPGSVQLDVPEQPLNTLSRWQVVRSENPSQVVLDFDRDHRTAILPPGEYQIASLAQGTGNWVTWPQKVQVQAGKGTAFKLPLLQK